MVCALIGHLWMHADVAAPETMASEPAATIGDVDGSEHGNDDEAVHHVMALACVATLAAGVFTLAQRSRMAATPVSGRSPMERARGWSTLVTSATGPGPDRVAAGVTLLI